MKKRVRDVEGAADSLGINLNTHLNFGVGASPLHLTPITAQQDSPEDVLDNLEKKV